MVRISDTFNRANNTSTLGNADTGQAWSALSGTWGINSNRAYIPTSSGSDDVVVVESNLADVTITSTLAVADTTNAIIFRCTDVNNFLMAQLESGLTSVYKRVASVFTDLIDFTYTAVNGDVVQVVAEGSSISVLVNGVYQIVINDSTLQTATKHGLRGFGSASTAMRWDDFSITENSHCIVTLLGTTL